MERIMIIVPNVWVPSFPLIFALGDGLFNTESLIKSFLVPLNYDIVQQGVREGIIIIKKRRGVPWSILNYGGNNNNMY